MLASRARRVAPGLRRARRGSPIPDNVAAIIGRNARRAFHDDFDTLNIMSGTPGTWSGGRWWFGDEVDLGVQNRTQPLDDPSFQWFAGYLYQTNGSGGAKGATVPGWSNLKLANGEDQAYPNADLIAQVPSLGSVFSVANSVLTITCSMMTPAERATQGLPLPAVVSSGSGYTPGADVELTLPTGAGTLFSGSTESKIVGRFDSGGVLRFFVGWSALADYVRGSEPQGTSLALVGGTGSGVVIDMSGCDFKDVTRYKSGALTSNAFNFRQGFAVAKVRYTNAQGLWPAVWFKNAGRSYGGAGESDMSEMPIRAGSSTLTTSNNQVHLHPSGAGGAQALGFDGSAQFFLVAMQWQADSIQSYFSPNETTAFTPGPSFTSSDGSFPAVLAPKQMLINLAVGGTTGSYPGLPAAGDTGPWSVQIDYIDVYNTPDRPI